MHKQTNYINALPDFLAMQRVSFCWFITQGLTEELALFSKIYDFSLKELQYGKKDFRNSSFIVCNENINEDFLEFITNS